MQTGTKYTAGKNKQTDRKHRDVPKWKGETILLGFSS